MVFSEPTFLFLFLPFVLILYFVFGEGVRNLFLLAASLFFYAWGEEIYVLVLLTSIAINYATGMGMDSSKGQARKAVFVLGIAANLLLLGYFKYFGFLLDNIGVEDAALHTPTLPIGISFFTFQALSYLIDLYFRRIKVQRNPLRLALYISLFPQLIAGPIVRYAEIEQALTDRRTTRSDFSEGMHRFVVGLAKKSLVADPLGLVADRIYAVPIDGLSPEVAWLGAIAYALQLYYDFSAYSDMAIGLGRIFGFKFPENFNYPYVARSVTEFWRRWHMTLSRWFRDYCYIPLGGNRSGEGRTYLNLCIVFLLTGFWHGAAWSFVFWGAYHGMFLIIERLGLGKLLERAPRGVAHLYLLLVVILGWVPFRAEGLEQSLAFYGAMLAGQSGSAAAFYPLAKYLDTYVAMVLIFGAIFALPTVPWMRKKIEEGSPFKAVSREVVFVVLFAASLISIGAASYSPFIYFRF